jgi:hypothetical protein
MANKILLKRSTTAAASPTAGQLDAGELAINTADGKLFAKNSAGTVVNLPVSSISGQAITPSSVKTTSIGDPTTPVYSFSADTNTGIFSPAADALAITTGGTSRLHVASNGKVGIGTDDPKTNLQICTGFASSVLDGTPQTEILQVIDGSSDDYVNLGRFHCNSANSRGSFSLSNSGTSGAWEDNVMQFFCHGSTYGPGYYGGNTCDAGCAMIVTQGGDIQKLQIGNYGYAPIELFTDNNPRVHISADGNVGIGTSSPTKTLHVEGDTYVSNTLDAGTSLGGSISTDTVYVNQTLTNVTAGIGEITFNDDAPSTAFNLNSSDGITVYATSGASAEPNGPGASAAFLSTVRASGIVYTYHLNTKKLTVTRGNFANTNDAARLTLVARQTTTNATANQVLFLDGSSARLVIPAKTTWMFTIQLSAYNDTDSAGAGWFFRGAIRRNGANGTALVNSLVSESWQDSAMSTATATVVADDTNEALEIRVTGIAAKNIRWTATVDITQCSYGTPG